METTEARSYYKAQYLQEIAGASFGESPSFEEWICLKAMRFENQLKLKNNCVKITNKKYVKKGYLAAMATMGVDYDDAQEYWESYEASQH